jgi:hypothetical protein
MHFLFFPQISQSTDLLQVRQQAPIERAARQKGPFFTKLSNFSQKFPQIKKCFLLSKALGKECPSIFPKSGAPMERIAHFQSLT